MERKKRRSLVDQRQTATRNPPRRRRLLLLGALRERPEARAKQGKCLSFTFYAGGTLFGSRRLDSGLGKVGWSGVGKGMVEGLIIFFALVCVVHIPKKCACMLKALPYPVQFVLDNLASYKVHVAPSTSSAWHIGTSTQQRETKECPAPFNTT